MTARRTLLLLTAVLLLAACGGSDEASSGSADAASSAPAAVASEAAPRTSAPASDPAGASASEAAGGALTVAETDLGEIVVDGGGMTVYVFDNDTDETSTCTGDCEANWPPVSGDVTAGDGVDGALLGSTEREDGSLQATYDGHPIYYFAGDEAAGDTNGQAVGGIWWVVAPDGAKITDEAAAADTGY